MLLFPFAVTEVASFSCLVKEDVSPSGVAVLRGPPGRWAMAVLPWDWPRRVHSSWCLWDETCAQADLLSPTSPLHVAPSPVTQSCHLSRVPEAASGENVAAGKLGWEERETTQWRSC